MLCQNCKQTKATVHLTSIKACRQIESHYCEPCSRSVDWGVPFAPIPGPAAAPEPPEEAWLNDADRAHLMCPDCRHVNQDDWNYCSACVSQRRP